MKVFYLFKPADSLLMFVCIVFSPLYVFALHEIYPLQGATPIDLAWAVEKFPRIAKLQSYLGKLFFPAEVDKFLTIYINALFIGLAFTLICFGVRALISGFADGTNSKLKHDRSILDLWVKFTALNVLFFLALLMFFLLAPLRDIDPRPNFWSREFFLNEFEVYLLFPVLNLVLYFSLLGFQKIIGNIFRNKDVTL